MTKTSFYAICARGKNAEDGFYKVKAENFSEILAYYGKTTGKCNLKNALMREFEELSNATIDFCNRKMHASCGWHDEIVHKPVAFVVEVNPHLPRAQISFDKEVKVFDSFDGTGLGQMVGKKCDECDNALENEPKNSRELCENALKNEAQSENVASACEDLLNNLKEQYNDSKNAENNEKITGEALKDRLIAKAFKDSKHLRAIFKKAKVETIIYFEDEAGEIVSLWYEKGEYEESGAIKALMMSKKAFIVVDLCENKELLIRFCKGFKSEWLDKNGEPIKDYQ